MRGRKPRRVDIPPSDLTVLRWIARGDDLPAYQVQRAKIVLAIAEGRHPPTLVLQRLLAPIPLAWTEQRQILGFTI